MPASQGLAARWRQGGAGRGQSVAARIRRQGPEENHYARARRARRGSRPDRARNHRGLVDGEYRGGGRHARIARADRKSTRLNSSHSQISYAVFCLKKKKKKKKTIK